MVLDESLIPKRIHPDIQKERDGASFNVTEFKEWWYDGADKLREKQEFENELFAGLGIDHSYDYVSHEELTETALKQLTLAADRLKKLQKKRNPGGFDIWPRQLYALPSHGLLPINSPLATHSTMFVDVILGQGTPEQIQKFGVPGQKCEIIGTYAQTELAHGTNVRGIETRADYDIKTDEFVLNTPSLESYKWWPGGLGHTANYAMVVAQLYINDEHKGIQMFIVPVRDAKTHMPLPGVDIGEIGKKVGMHGVNQGYLGLKNVRIPRGNMLMRNAKVHRDGSFVQSPASKLAYLTMVFTRCLIVNQNATFLLEAATIATRYSAIRRQSHINPNEREPQIMDHVTQQMKLFPEIVTGIAFLLSARHLWQKYDQTKNEINSGNYKGLAELHILSCTLKVLCTTDSCAGIERLRLSCGGHGFLAAANFGTIYGNAVAAYTYEGENTVLLLQIGKFLVKSWHQMTQDQKLSESVEYLTEVNRMHEFPKWNNSWECIVRALQYTAANKTRIAFENLGKRMASGETQEEALNHTGIEITQAAELHGRQAVAAILLRQITAVKAGERSTSLNNVLHNVLELFLVHTALRFMSDILRFINLTADDVQSLQDRLEVALKKFRPEAIAICDGFDFRDIHLNSVLGCYDGNVYERIYAATKESPLNQQPVPKLYEKYLKPFLKSNL